MVPSDNDKVFPNTPIIIRPSFLHFTVKKKNNEVSTVC